MTEEPYKAARQLDLTYLPRLQCCQVTRSHPIVYEDDDYPCRHDYGDLVTLRLAAPHLTRLLLINHFKDVEGLQDCTKLQQLRLQGCAVNLPHLAQVIAGLPSLVDFWYSGTERVHGAPWMADPRPILWASIAQQQQLAATLGAATQLTSLFINSLSEYGIVKVGDKGQVTVNPEYQWLTDHTFKGWAGQIRDLSRLECLVMAVPMEGADVLQLTQLTAMTKLNIFDARNVSGSTWDELLEHMPRLQELNGCLMVDIGW